MNIHRWRIVSRNTWCQAVLLSNLASLVPMVSLGAEQSAEPAQQTSFFDFLNASHDYWSLKVIRFADSIDRFFANSTSFEEANESVLQIDLNEVVKQGGDSQITLTTRAYLLLPLAEKRLHLLVEPDPEKVATVAASKDQAVLPTDVEPSGSYAAAVRYQVAEKNIWHFSAGAGIRLRSSLDPFVRARGSVSIPLRKWRLKLEQNVFWFNTIGAGESTKMDIDHLLGIPVLFRATSNVIWLHEKQSLDLSQSLSIIHTINDHNAMLYQVSAIGVSQPEWQVTDYVALARWRRRLHQDWLFMEISPQLHYPEVLGYRLDPLVILRLEMLFGGKRTIAIPVPPIDSSTP